MSTVIRIEQSLPSLCAAFWKATGVAPSVVETGHYVLELGLAPEPLQVARAEQVLARRGWSSDLRSAHGRIRLDIERDGEGTRLRFEGVMRLGPTVVDLTDDQQRRLEEALRTLPRHAAA